MEPETVVRKPRSEAQKQATANALKILKERREALKKESKPKEVPANDYVSKKELDAYLETKLARKPKKQVVYESESDEEVEIVKVRKPAKKVVYEYSDEEQEQPKQVQPKHVQQVQAPYEPLNDLFFRRR